MAHIPPTPPSPPAGSPTPPDVLTEAKGIIGRLIEKILRPLASFLPKKNLNVFLSLLDPWVTDPSAEAAAGLVQKYLMAYPWIADKKVSAGIKAFAAGVEDEADKHTEPTKAVLKKAADWFETFATALHEGVKNGHAGAPVASSEASDKALHEHIRKHLEDCRVQLVAEKDPTKKRELRAELETDTILLFKLKKLVQEGPPPPEKPTAPTVPKVPFGERVKAGAKGLDDAVKPILEPVIRELQTSTEKRRKENEQRRAKMEQEVAKRKTLGSPLRALSRVLFGFPR